MRCSIGVFYLHAFFLRFSRPLPRVYDTNMLVSKTQVETREKRVRNARKIKNASPTREDVSILHYVLGKNMSQLCFFSRFSRVLFVFYSRFTRVLLAFYSHYTHILLAFYSCFTRVLLVFYSRFTRVLLTFLLTNANQKHSVIRA